MEKIVPYKDPSAKIMIDKNVDCVNSVSGELLHKIADSTLSAILVALSEHCGPMSKYTLQTHVNGSELAADLHISKFTNDGIGIVQGMDFINPLQKHFTSMVSYIGQRVDGCAKDGTTTSMMLGSSMMSAALTMQKSMRSDLIGINRSDLIHSFFDSLKKKFNAHPSVFTKDETSWKLLAEQTGFSDVDELRTHIASSVAYIASKGNVELVDAIKELFSTRPKETLNDAPYIVSRVETEKQFFVDSISDEFAPLCSSVTSRRYFNHRLGSEYKAESCYMLIVPEGSGAGWPNLQLCKTIIDSMDGIEEDLVILGGEFTGDFIQYVDKYNLNHKNKCLVFSHQMPNIGTSTVTILDVINASAKKLSPTDALDVDGIGAKAESVLHSNVNVHYHNGVLSINGIIPDNDHSKYNPRYVKKDWERYNSLENDLRMGIETESNKHNPNFALLSHWASLYNHMLCSHVPPILVIGGNSTTAVANKDVVVDVLGSVMAVLNNGFVIDGISTLYECVSALLSEYEESLTETHAKEAKLLYHLAEKFASTLGFIRSCVLSGISRKSDQMFPLRTDVYSAFTVKSTVEVFSIRKYYADFIRLNKDEFIPIQSYLGYTEMLDRVAESCVNLISLYQIQMTGAVLINNTSEGK